MRPVVNYLAQVRAELSKVEWPENRDVLKLTLTVIVISGIVGIFLGALDIGFAKLLEIVIAR